MHVRLLDMGMVNILRSQSIYHAIASGMVGDSDPALIILRPDAPYLSINKDEVENKDFCNGMSIPLIHRKIAAGCYYHDQNQLLLMFIFPKEQSESFGLNEGIIQLTKAVVLAFNKLGVAVKYDKNSCFLANAKKIGMANMDQQNRTSSFFCALNLDRCINKSIQENSKLVPQIPVTSVAEEIGKVPSLEGSAEALLSSFEELFNMALIPSMPMPEEMDLIYDWDNKLTQNSKPSIRNPQKLSGLLN